MKNHKFRLSKGLLIALEFLLITGVHQPPNRGNEI